MEELAPVLGQQDCRRSVSAGAGSDGGSRGEGGRGGKMEFSALALTTLIGTKWSAEALDFHFKIGRGVPTGNDLLASLWHRALSLLSNCPKDLNVSAVGKFGAEILL